MASDSQPRRRRRRHYALVVLGLLVVVGALATLKYCQIATLISFGEQAERAGPPPEVVGSALARSETWAPSLTAVGTVTGAESVTVASELAGVVTKLRFDSGDVVRRGQVLVELDASAERADLASAQATLSRARLTERRMRALVAAGAAARAQLDDAVTQRANAEGAVKAARARVEDKVVRAPFAGRTGIRAVKLGQYLAPGTEITTVSSNEAPLVDFTLPQEQLGEAEVGTPVRVELRGGPTLAGEIAAIDPAIDPATRAIRLRARVREGAAGLRAGMFVTVTVMLPATGRVVVVPATAIVHAAFGDSVFVVADKPPDEPGMRTTPDGRTVRVARQQFVRLGTMRGDFVAVVEGLDAGAEVVTAGAFKLRNGAPIVIDNTVQAKPQKAPRPRNR